MINLKKYLQFHNHLNFEYLFSMDLMLQRFNQFNNSHCLVLHILFWEDFYTQQFHCTTRLTLTPISDWIFLWLKGNILPSDIITSLILWAESFLRYYCNINLKFETLEDNKKIINNLSIYECEKWAAIEREIFNSVTDFHTI